jgi:putative addiction module killer protein
MRYRTLESTEFGIWLSRQKSKDKLQIDKRLDKIRQEGYFGDIKDLEDDIWELKWKGGRRIYYAYLKEQKILLLLGGNKNGQSHDITQARKILQKYL